MRRKVTRRKINDSFKNKDVISIDDFNKEEILYIFKLAQGYEKKVNSNFLKGKIAATLFFEPSTRTHQSFSSAAQRLGAGVIGFNNVEMTSMKKGETFEDTLRIIANLSDVIIIRHPQAGSAQVAADTVTVPVINAGDGPNHHPTQTLLDMYTIQKVFKRLDNLVVAFVGDPKHYRTFHGLFSGLSKFSGNQIYGVSPKGLEMPAEFRDKNYHDVVINMKNLDESLAKLKPDIVCVGRIPKEYIKGDASKYDYQITANTVKKLPSHTVIMHPLPIVNEINREVDNFPNAIYFKQAKSGLYVRMALLSLILGERGKGKEERKNPNT